MTTIDTERLSPGQLRRALGVMERAVTRVIEAEARLLEECSPDAMIAMHEAVMEAEDLIAFLSAPKEDTP